MPAFSSTFFSAGLKDQGLHETTNNYRRLVRVGLDTITRAVRCILGETWGAEQTRVYAFYLD